MNKEKGSPLSPTLTSSSALTASQKRFGSTSKVHPASPIELNGVHSAPIYQRQSDHYEHGAPFRLEHHLHHEHPLRHPNAVHWRSAYSVISLHRKYKELQASGGHPDIPNNGRNNTSYEQNYTSGSISNAFSVDSEKMRFLEEENKRLVLELEEKTAEVEKLKVALKSTESASADFKRKFGESGINVDEMLKKLEDMQQFKEKQIAKAVLRWKNADLLRAFNIWESNVREIVSNRRLIARFSARWRRTGTHGVFVRWHDMVRSEKYNRSVIKKFAARFKHQALSKCFYKWQHEVNENLRLKRLQNKVAKRFLLLKLSAAFHGW